MGIFGNKEYRQAKADLDDYADKQVKKYGKGNVPETAKYVQLNRRVGEAADRARRS